jgi:biotin transport system substrate-specific component
MNRSGLMTVAEVYSPQRTFTAAWWLYQVIAVFAGSALIALSAQLEIMLPFSPVPITGQTFSVLLIAALLGRVRGTAAVLAYLAEGTTGLPVFAGGAAGVGYVFGPTGGYLIGFLPAAFVVGALAEHGWDRNVFLTAFCMALGSVVCFAAGLTWLSVFVGWERVLPLGLYPFIAGDILKIAAAAAALPALRRFV